jgi:ABC-type antimicrobial peptide transport system permease subunit
MIRNYLKTTFRSLRKNLTYTIVNVLGLGIGLSGMLITYALVEYEYQFDNQFNNTVLMYRINSTRLIENKVQKWGITPLPLGSEAVNDISGIESFTRYGTSRVIIKYEDNTHSENLYYADYNFFHQFDFPLLKGDKSSFNEKNTALISSDFSRKYFGEEESLGKQVDVMLNDETVQSFIIGGILDKIPRNSSFKFDIIVPYENIFEIYELEETSWTVQIPTITYVTLRDHINPSIVEENLKRYVEKNNELLDTWKVSDFYLMPFKDQKDESRSLYSAITWSGLPLSALYGSLFMNLIIFLIACFNFTNTAIAYAQKRLKEIGIRKTFGSLKKQILAQFLLENFIQSVAALIIGMDLARRWIIWMNVQWPIEISVNYFSNLALMIFLFVILVVVTLLAGAYPAFYISRFQPSNILKGDIKFGGTNPFNRILLTWQFGLSITAIIAGIVLSLNARYQSKLDFGYNKENVIVVPLYDNQDFEPYKNAILNLKGINQIAGAIHNVGFGFENIEINIDGNEHHAERLLIGENYLNTLELKIISGRDFRPDSENDMNESIIVNQKFLETYEIEDPYDQAIKMDENIYYIVGVIQNYMPFGLFRPINPVILKKVPDEGCQLLCVNAEKSNLSMVYDELLSNWKSLFPNKPFEGYYQQEALSNAENINTGILKQFIVLSVFALFLSTSGLFSMVSLSINKRIKEIGIRKVMGASVPQIFNLLNREFLIILGIASIFGSVLGYYFMDAFLGDIFDYHLDIGPGVFIVSISIIIIAVLFTSGRKIYQASQLNPAESLKYE